MMDTMATDAMLVTRIAVGAILGGVIGYERDRHRRPVGLRTHAIVAMAAATFMVISSHFVYWQHYSKDDLVSVDTSRIAASVVSAIGFIAGGAILRNGLNVTGLTTAAGLWLVAAIGMSSGAGMYVESIFVTMLGLFALTFLRRFEDKDDHIVLRRVQVTCDDATSLSQVRATLKVLGAHVEDIQYEHRLDDEKKRIISTFEIRVVDTVGIPKVIEAIEAVPQVRRVHVERGS
jgi:putative Mg2+ transporter-C (MgtC) family protein